MGPGKYCSRRRPRGGAQFQGWACRPRTSATPASLILNRDRPYLDGTKGSHTGNTNSAGNKIRYSLAVWFSPGIVCRTSGSWGHTWRCISMPRFPSTLPLHLIGLTREARVPNLGNSWGNEMLRGQNLGILMLTFKRTEARSSLPQTNGHNRSSICKDLDLRDTMGYCF